MIRFRSFFGPVVETGIIRVFGAVGSSARCNAHVRIVRWALFTITVLSGAVIILRAVFGPLTFPVKVTNPVNPEAWFGLALVTDRAASRTIHSAWTRRIRPPTRSTPLWPRRTPRFRGTRGHSTLYWRRASPVSASA